MPKAATRSKAPASITTIDESIDAYLAYVKSNFPAAALRNATAVLSMLKNYLDGDDDGEESAGALCKESVSAAMISRLDRFLRYRLMRELVVSLEQQQCAFFVTFDFCEWLRKKDRLADKEYRQIQALRDELLEMWKKGYEVAETIELSLQRTKPPGRGAEMIEFARHDILKIEGDQIWLEIWFPIILPRERKIGPIDLPKGLAASLQVGWMITCELKKSKSGWRISEIGNIYPSLPFK